MVLEWEDWVVIGVYFVVILGTGLGVSFFTKKSSGNATDFLLAGRSMWFLPVAFSLFSSNIGSSHFIGLAGTGASGLFTDFSADQDSLKKLVRTSKYQKNIL